MTGKTLQTYLPEGTPSGIRIAELTTRIVLAVAIPRTKLQQFFERPEANHIGTYFLFGGSDDNAKPIAYIGQTEDLKTRFKKHDSEKEFWTTAVALVSRTHSFTQAHIRWLEWHSILKAKEANRFHLDNGNAGSEPFATAPMKADLAEIFDTGALLVESLGFPVFRPLVERAQPGAPTTDKELWHLEGPSVRATALFTEDGFIVLRGSKARAEFTPSAAASPFARKRERMVQEGILKLEGESYVYQENYIFNSPSGAAAVTLARHSNGWNDWKDKHGRTLDEVKRQKS